jgi:broad specificity phosphatase PhoE
MQRLLLIRHASTAASDSAAFPLDEPLTEVGRRLAAGLRDVLASGVEAFSSPALRCRQTAAAAGFHEHVIEPAIAECDFGSWAGRTLAEIHASDPDAATRWMTDPAARPHGGESLLDLLARVGGWLDACEPPSVAITHGGVIKAAVVHALGAPVDAFWRIAVAPLSIVELIRRCDTWELSLNPGPA